MAKSELRRRELLRSDEKRIIGRLFICISNVELWAFILEGERLSRHSTYDTLLLL
jgi:hypothetical protein